MVLYKKKFFFLFLIIILIITSYLSKKKILKVALCSIGKKENLYVKEFISYYIKLGIDHFFIYDDNEPNSEKISSEIEFSFKKFITIYENKFKSQSNSYNDCYRRNNNKYDWFLIVDFDEYLYIKHDTLKNYLSRPIFHKCDFIHFHWVIATDNNLIHYDKRPLFERFKHPYLKSKFIKSIIRGNIKNLTYQVHSPIKSPYKNISCDSSGKKIYYKSMNIEELNNINIKRAYIIHFRFKSTEEFINKYKRGYGIKSVLKNLISEYFKYNKITLDKINYIKKELNLSFVKYKSSFSVPNVY